MPPKTTPPHLARREKIHVLLVHYQDVQHPLFSVDEARGSDGGVMLMPEAWNATYRELERCLRELRTFCPKLYWHVTERYLRCVRRTVDKKVRWKAKRKKAAATVVRRRLEESWDSRVNPIMVELGVAWIAREFQGEPFLPEDLFKANA